MEASQAAGTQLAKKEEKKHSLSNSQIETLSKCGEQYRRRYILHQRTARGLSLIVGSAVDDIVTLNLDKKMMTGELMSIEEVRDRVVDRYRRNIQEARQTDEGIHFKESEIEDGEDVSIASGEAKAVRLAILHAEDAAPTIQPIYVQRPLHVELPGYPFDIGAVLDIQELDSIRDTKTKSKTPAKTVADTDDQLTIYAMLVALTDGTIPPKLFLDCLIDNKTPTYKPFVTSRLEEDFDVLLRRVAVASEAIQGGTFLPARESDWWCGKDWCGYWEYCKYVRRSTRPTS